MATISDLWESFSRFQSQQFVIDLEAEYQLGLWADGSCELLHDGLLVTRWNTFDEAVEWLNEQAAQNG